MSENDSDENMNEIDDDEIEIDDDELDEEFDRDNESLLEPQVRHIYGLQIIAKGHLTGVAELGGLGGL